MSLARLQPAQRQLVQVAREARRHAHAPYSGFKVGAAVRRRDGKVFAGCNVENLSYGAGICAERGAILHAVSQGMRAGQLQEVAVYTTASRLTPPCGMCLQVLQEFADNPQVILANARSAEVHHLRDLLPHPFSPFEAQPEVGRATRKRG